VLGIRFLCRGRRWGRCEHLPRLSLQARDVLPLHAFPGKEQRDVPSELRLAEVLKEDLKLEEQKERWMPLWGLPVH